jgi:aryl-alcohol dehydrogenase-like predicted oxidoreductase
LTGKYSAGASPRGRLKENFLRLADTFLTQRNLAVVSSLEAFCSERGHSLLELAVSWLAQQTTVASVICGATEPEQVEQNVKAAAWTLSADELARVDELTRVG